jgi:integrase
MSEDAAKTDQEKEKEEYQKLVVESCEYLLPILTKFKNLDTAPHHTLYHLGLIVDNTLKSFAAQYRTEDFFKVKDRRFNIGRIESKLLPQGINAEQTSRLKNLFNKFVVYVTQELGWVSAKLITDQLVLPRVLPVVREKQMFNLDLAKHYRNIIQTYCQNIRSLGNNQLIGLIALSAVFESKRLHIRFIESILNATSNDLIWLDEENPVLNIGNQEGNQQHIRVHNSTLLILLEKFRRQSSGVCLPEVKADQIRKAVHSLCNDYLKNQPIALSDLSLPTQLNKIIEIAGADYFMHRPAFFHAAMTGNQQQTPLAIETKLRTLTGKPVKRIKNIASLENGANSRLSNDLINSLNKHELLEEGSKLTDSIKPLSWQLETIKNVLKSLEGLSKQKASKHLQAILETPVPNLSLMSIWLIAWLNYLYAGHDNHEVNRKAKKSLKQNSILRYFSTVYRHVLPAFDNMDVADLEEDEWIELLQECLDNSKDSQLFKPLSRFVRFLIIQFNIPVLPMQDLEGNQGFSNVNANLVTPYEVYEILSKLMPSDNQNASSITRMQACALILGFFCGLRRKEVLGLRMTDIYGHSYRPYLYLRPHRDRGLKNAYSRRRLDLIDLVPEPYLKILMDWHQHQKSLGMKFLMSFSEHEIGDDKTIIDPVQEYCRQVTEDETFVFHGLRHSFANLHLIRILQISKPELSKWLGSAKRKFFEKDTHIIALDYFYSAENAKAFLKKYFPTQNQTLPRSTLLQLAMLLGHKVPETTSRSYLHLIDEIENNYFDPIDEKIKEGWINQYWTFEKPYQRTRFKNKLIDIEEEGAKKIDETKLMHTLYENALKQPVICQLDHLILEPSPLIIHDDLGSRENTDWPNPILVENIYPIYKQLFVYSTPVEDIASAFALPKQDVQSIRDNALAISEIKTSKGKPRFKHPFLLRRSNELEKRLNSLMKKIAKTEVDIEAIKSGIDLYLQGSQARNAYRVMLKNAEEFNNYLQLLKEIQLPVSQIGIRIYPSSHVDKTNDELNAYWTKQFQQTMQTSVKPALTRIYAPISTKAEFGQVEVEPLKIQNGNSEFLEYYQYAAFLLVLLMFS